jgi:hypothetical protein
MSNQLGTSKKQKPFSFAWKLNTPIKPKEILRPCGQMDMNPNLYMAKTQTTTRTLRSLQLIIHSIFPAQYRTT